MMKSSGASVPIQWLSAFLGIYCLSLSASGYLCYSGNRHFDSGRFLEASQAFLNARKVNPLDARTWYSEGLAEFNLGRRTKKNEHFLKAKTCFQSYVQHRPYDGRAWMYLALADLNGGLLDQGGLTQAKWIEIRSLFARAEQQEPGNLWIRTMISLSCLSQQRFLTASEIRSAESRLLQALSIHDAHLPSRYLKSVLKQLWSVFSDVNLLQRVVPQDVPSYKVFKQFLMEHGAWMGLPEIEMTAYRLSQGLYRQLLNEGLGLLQQGQYEEAGDFFKKASWIQLHGVEASAGLLVVQMKLQHTVSGDVSPLLSNILRHESEELNRFLPYLEEVVHQSEDRYLESLYAYRVGDYGASCKAFSRISPADGATGRRYWAAQACLRAGFKDEAVRILRPAVSDGNADIREWILLSEIVPENQQGIDQKIKTHTRASLKSSLWWANGMRSGVLNRKAKMYMGLNLKPGKNLLKIKARCLPDLHGRGAYMTVSLEDELIGAAYVENGVWQDFPFEVMTSGGKQRLSVNLVNGAEAKTVRPRPILELGELQVNPGE